MTVRIPMAFTEVEVGEVERLIASEEWVFEQKFDGTRGLAVISPKGVWFPGRGGRGALAHTAAIQHLPKINAVLAPLMDDGTGEIVLDGEIMTRTGEFLIWDVAYLRVGGAEMVKPEQTLHHRRQALEGLAEMMPEGGPVKVVRQARSTRAKRELWEAVMAAGGEGVMAKRLDSPYESGQRVKHSLKLKFVKTADVVVTAVDRPDAKHGSFSLGAYNEVGEMVRVGGCSAIGKDPETKVGDVIEVAYLYATADKILYQPRMRHIRTDKAPTECLVSQFPAYSREAV